MITVNMDDQSGTCLEPSGALRQRREQPCAHNQIDGLESQANLEQAKARKTFGRTPDGTGKLTGRTRHRRS